MSQVVLELIHGSFAASSCLLKDRLAAALMQFLSQERGKAKNKFS